MQNPKTWPSPKYKRIMLKISGEALMGSEPFGFDPKTVSRIADEVRHVHDLGVDICMVIGGGNIFRGYQGKKLGIERSTSDSMGMVATLLNALAMQSALEARTIDTRVMSSIRMDQICEPYIRRRALRHLEKKRICILAGGTGSPFFTTDTAAVLRAGELACEFLFKGTNVDGVYSGDPKTDGDARRYDIVSYTEVLKNDLHVMDASAIALARDSMLPIAVFSIEKSGELAGVVEGKGTYTIIR